MYSGMFKKFMIMKLVRRAGFFSAVLMFLSACVATQGRDMAAKMRENAPEQEIIPDRMIEYNCDDGRRVEVTLKGAQRVQLKINGAVAELLSSRASSGAKFQSADKSIVFWLKDNEATIETTGAGAKKATMVCSVTPD